VDAALDRVAQQLQSRQVQAADWDALRTAVRERGTSGGNEAAAMARTKRFEQMIDRLGRVENPDSVEIDRIRGAIVDERLDSALARWRDAVAAGKASEQEYEDVKQQLARRAEIAQSADPDAAERRAKLQARLDALRARAENAPVRPDDVDEFRGRLFDARLQRTLADLERRAARKELASDDLDGVRWLLADRAETAENDPGFRAIQTRLQNALQGLERRLATGQIDAEEFAKLRASFTQKAREASTETTDKDRAPTRR